MLFADILLLCQDSQLPKQQLVLDAFQDLQRATDEIFHES
jgi:hypothetical protein